MLAVMVCDLELHIHQREQAIQPLIVFSQHLNGLDWSRLRGLIKFETMTSKIHRGTTAVAIIHSFVAMGSFEFHFFISS